MWTIDLPLPPSKIKPKEIEKRGHNFHKLNNILTIFVGTKPIKKDFKIMIYISQRTNEL
jgi:hypothetical protein